MAVIKPITTSEQVVTATGAVTGTLDTSAITGNFNLRIRVRDLTAGHKIMLSIEDTANASAFSDALPIAVFHFEGTGTGGGAAGENAMDQERQWYDVKAALLGAANNKLRVNCLRIDASSTCFVDCWMEA
jgi:hypothetical protein